MSSGICKRLKCAELYEQEKDSEETDWHFLQSVGCYLMLNDTDTPRAKCSLSPSKQAIANKCRHHTIGFEPNRLLNYQQVM